MLREFRTQRIIWDTANSRLFEPVQAVEGDENGRQLEVQIVNEGKVEQLNNVGLKLAWETQDRSTGNLEPFDVLDSSKGLFKLSYPTGMLAHKGRLKASLVIYFADGKLESREFEIYNQRSLVRTDAMESSNEFTALTQALVKINDLESNYAPQLQQVTRQLAQTATFDYVDMIISNIVSGSPKGTFLTVEALRNAYPDGTEGVFLVLENDSNASHVYFWNGADWEDAGVYQGTGLAAVMTTDGAPWEVS
jgi:hypothetical protein